MFCAPGLVFGDTEGVGSRFHVLRSRTRFHVLRSRSRFHVLRSRTLFRRFLGRRVSFSYSTLPDSFTAVRRASDLVFMFFAPGHVFRCAEGLGSLFTFGAPRLVFGGTEGVGSRFHVLRSRTHFRRYRGRGVPLSCFARPNSFSAVPRASGPVFLFCTPGLVFGGAECLGS
jgi:hypothetical protein